MNTKGSPNQIKRAKEILKHTSYAFVLGLSMSFLPSCSNQEEEATWEEVSYTNGIMSFINEKAPGEFEIVKEETVPYDQSAAVVTYLNGKVDTLSPELSKKIIDDGIKSESHLNNNNLGLSNMLLYGAMGYMIGRNMNNGYMNRYREDRQRAGGTSGFYRPGAYSGSTNAIAQVENSKTVRTTNTRPSNGRSGFFSQKSGGTSVGG